jgi:hypothetical protein
MGTWNRRARVVEVGAGVGGGVVMGRVGGSVRGHHRKAAAISAEVAAAQPARLRIFVALLPIRPAASADSPATAILQGFAGPREQVQEAERRRPPGRDDRQAPGFDLNTSTLQSFTSTARA